METKLCTKCKKEKALFKFGKRGTNKDKSVRYCSWCKKCCTSYGREWAHKNKDLKNQIIRRRKKEIKQACIDLCGGRCQICGYSKCIAALDFHHSDANSKEGEISSLGMERALEEAAKCILVCANCHREIHYVK